MQDNFIKIFINNLNTHTLELNSYNHYNLVYDLRKYSGVEIAGIIIGRVRYNAKHIYTIDDGTAIISVIEWVNDQMQDSPFYDFGQFLVVRGYLRKYNNKFEINAKFINLEEQVDAESFHWLRTIQIQSLFKNKIK
eukprot:TRINITY_DN7634_c0_g1_i1.p1 TRINITY_DN7634_c0_g1~~TRINITY_DN7634_c0_g1_i1.p1  ORF type:complete len:136 (-),score=28.53 TRINITY_DN7634_c0_g1_i1:19-426(-)